MKSKYKVPAGDEMVEVVVEINGKFLDPVMLQVRRPAREGQSGFVFAPFAANPAYHGESMGHWQMVGKAAMARYMGQEGFMADGEIRPEYTQPTNLMVEFH